MSVFIETKDIAGSYFRLQRKIGFFSSTSPTINCFIQQSVAALEASKKQTMNKKGRNHYHYKQTKNSFTSPLATISTN
jgi:hypothetical protein